MRREDSDDIDDEDSDDCRVPAVLLPVQEIQFEIAALGLALLCTRFEQCTLENSRTVYKLSHNDFVFNSFITESFHYFSYFYRHYINQK